MAEAKIKENKPVRCPKCNSTQTYYRRKKKEYVCTKCGTTFAGEKNG